MATLLYRLFNEADELIYIGISGRLTARVEAHLHSKPWADQIAHVRAVAFADRNEARRAEREAIRLENPKYNIQHKPCEFVLADKLRRFWAGLDQERKTDALAALQHSKIKLHEQQDVTELQAAIIAMLAEAQGLSCDALVAQKLLSRP
jgi:predicted GIY-YIG superfamily endonuclease